MGRLPGAPRKKGFRKSKTKVGREPKCIDQVYEEAVMPKYEQDKQRLRKPLIDPDLPGFGQFYCMACARHFTDKNALNNHMRTKPHKRRVKLLKKEVPYGIDREEVYGMPIDNGPRLRSADAKDAPMSDAQTTSNASTEVFDKLTSMID